MALSSDDINYLVYRYLLEAGFTHSAFTFSHESQVVRQQVHQDADIQPGTLVAFLQKGIQYREMEANMDEGGTELGKGFIPLNTQELLTKDLNDLRAVIQNRRAQRGQEIEHFYELDEQDLLTLAGHSKEVYVCSWHPHADLLATGSGDATVKLWNFEERDPIHESREFQHTAPADSAPVGSESTEITSLDWTPDGRFLASASYDGFGRLWDIHREPGDELLCLLEHKVLVESKDDKSGEKVQKYERHPIFCIKFNTKGDTVVTGSAGHTIIAWDARAATAANDPPIKCTPKIKFDKVHTGPVLDLDWQRNSRVFASASQDGKICIWRTSDQHTRPLLQWPAHGNEVNAVKWSPDGKMLASCSDDRSAKIWTVDVIEQQYSQLRSLEGHQGHSLDVYTCEWSPNSPSPVLATASFDNTVKLWDALRGTCLCTLQEHNHHVYSISFSRDGKLLASGGFDKKLVIWDAKSGVMLHSCTTSGGVFETSWNAAGDRVAASLASKDVCVLHLRK